MVNFTLVDSFPLLENPSLGPLINTKYPTNNSYVTGNKGQVPFLIDVITSGTLSYLVPPVKIFLNNSWWNMTETSEVAGENSSYGFFSDFSAPADHGQTYTVYYNLTNNNSFSNIYKLNFTVDNVAPTHTIQAPATPDQFITDDFMVRVNAQDALAGIETVQLTIKQEFEPFTEFSTVDLNYIGSDFWEYNWRVKSNAWTEGYYNLTIMTIDKAGLTHEETVRVRVDYTNPQVALITPLNETVRSGSFTINLQATDPIAGITSGAIKIGTNPASIPVVEDSENPGLFPYAFDSTAYVDGWLNFTFISQNGAGLANQTTFEYIIDNSDPTGAILLPAQSVLSGLQELQVTGTDTSGFSRVAWRIDNNPYHDLSPSTGSALDQTFTIDTERFAGGVHTLWLYLADNVDPVNVREVSYAVTIDRLRPNVVVHNLRSGDSIPDNFIVNISIVDDNLATVTLNFSITNEDGTVEFANDTIERDAESGLWQLDFSGINLKPGVYALHLKSEDLVGHIDLDTYAIIVYPAPKPLIDPVVLAIIIAAGVVILAGLGYYYWRKRSGRWRSIQIKSDPSETPAEGKD